MKRNLFAIAIAVLALVALRAPAHGQMVTAPEAQNIAQNWIALEFHNQGSWGGAAAAQVKSVEPFARGQRVLGFFCAIEPQGYIIVSLRRELAPVKAYSVESNLDPSVDEGMTDLLKYTLERTLDAIEQQTGPIENVPTAQLEALLEFSYRATSDALIIQPDAFLRDLGDGLLLAIYQAGGILLTTSWDQAPPYNNQCPYVPCTWEPSYYNNNAAVGCVATAGAQIMRYWCWPPSGVGSPYSDTYDWANMLDRCWWDSGQGRFEDDAGNALTQAQINAVAELCHEVGVAVNMSYGCSSESFTYDMEGVYENQYRYSTTCAVRYRADYTAANWFALLQGDLNINRPLHYRVDGHSIVCDGWQVVQVGGNPTNQYHMNYGWNDGHTTWYTVDNLLFGGLNEEYVLENIVPAVALGSALSGTYPWQSFPYRYFDRDATGASAVFDAAQHIQFLPDVTVRCTGTTGQSIKFYGASGPDNTFLYTRGDPTAGARIYTGCIKLSPGGTVVLR